MRVLITGRAGFIGSHLCFSQSFAAAPFIYALFIYALF